MLQAAASIFPDVAVRGCGFHWNQAVWCKVELQWGDMPWSQITLGRLHWFSLRVLVAHATTCVRLEKCIVIISESPIKHVISM